MGLINFLKKEKKSENIEVPLFNINIALKGWKGPFKDIAHFELIADRERDRRNCNGDFYVLSGGRLLKGKKENLHTFKGDLDLEEYTHVHHNYGIHISDIISKNGDLFFSHIFGTNPVYTLQGLYNSLPNKKINTKINMLIDALETHTNYKFNSISKRKETKLKILENAYKRLISNQ